LGRTEGEEKRREGDKQIIYSNGIIVQGPGERGRVLSSHIEIGSCMGPVPMYRVEHTET
jgi:hypothetical protein